MSMHVGDAESRSFSTIVPFKTLIGYVVDVGRRPIYPTATILLFRAIALLVAAAEPAREATLGFRGTLIDGAVKLVGGLDSLCLSFLCICLNVALSPAGLLVGFG